MQYQKIGADIGRGYVKGYTEFGDEVESCIFKAAVATGRELDEYNVEKPIHIGVDNNQYFIGELAFREGDTIRYNYSDDKTTETAEKLLYTLLLKLAKTRNVQICLGVPNKMFSKKTLNEVVKKYKNKAIVIEDFVNNTVKKIYIGDIIIMRESDSAMFGVLKDRDDSKLLMNKKLGMVTIGFRTTEISYFDKGLIYLDKYSDTIEKGHDTVLEKVKRNLKKDGIIKSVSELDLDEEYKNKREAEYPSLIESIDQEVEMKWKNYPEMKIFLAGGTSLEFKYIPPKYELVSDAQLITAKGLYTVAEKRFK